MSDVPFVSVIIPTHNREPTILDSIQSVLNQTYPHFELLVVDDGSTDGSVERIAEVRDDRLRLIPLPVSQGSSAARNAGLQEARAPWVAFQDSDDLWLPEKLETQCAVVRELPESFVGSYTSYWRICGNRRQELPRPRAGLDGSVLAELSRGNFISTQTLMVRTRTAREIGGFDVHLSALNDWDFVLRLAGEGDMRWVRKVLVEYRLQQDSLSVSLCRFLQNYQRILDKHASLMTSSPAAAAWHWAVMGNRLCREGAVRSGRKLLRKAWSLQPWDLRYAGAHLFSHFVRPDRELDSAISEYL